MSTPAAPYERVADALVRAYAEPDGEAMKIVWDYFGHMRAWDALRRYVRLDLGRPETPQPGDADAITIDDARLLVARAQGFNGWAALEHDVASAPAGRAVAAKSLTTFVAGASDARTSVIRTRDWHAVIDRLRADRVDGLDAEGVDGLDADGQMTDAWLGEIAALDHITTLDLAHSKSLTNEGLASLARLPRLGRLNLSGCSRITDRGLEVLRQLPALESVDLSWTRVTDQGVAPLAACDQLRAVSLIGTATGNGAIRTLAGKAHLADFRSGNGVTDDGLSLLHELPVFTRWAGGEPRMALLGFDAGPTFLYLRGALTDAGFRRLVGLDGLFALNVDAAELALSGHALTPLAALPHLGWLAFDAKDDSMPGIAALPHLRFLMCQDTTAGDAGFAALGRSPSIEYIWGRRCHNLRRRGFTALAAMPALRALSVSCRNVDDAGLSSLPDFPALVELMPMDVPDAGYRHIAACPKLESLVLMYCRDTGDEATSHIVRLKTLTKYFASYNRITDRTPDLLSGMDTLEDATFDSCAGLTDAGIRALARLPRLRTLRVSGMPKVTADVAGAFGAGVRVHHTT